MLRFKRVYISTSWKPKKESNLERKHDGEFRGVCSNRDLAWPCHTSPAIVWQNHQRPDQQNSLTQPPIRSHWIAEVARKFKNHSVLCWRILKTSLTKLQVRSCHVIFVTIWGCLEIHVTYFNEGQFEFSWTGWKLSQPPRHCHLVIQITQKKLYSTSITNKLKVLLLTFLSVFISDTSK